MVGWLVGWLAGVIHEVMGDGWCDKERGPQAIKLNQLLPEAAFHLCPQLREGSGRFHRQQVSDQTRPDLDHEGEMEVRGVSHIMP